MRIVNVENGQGYDFENGRDYYVNLYNKLNWVDELAQARKNSKFSFKNRMESNLVSLKDVMTNLTLGDSAVTISDFVKEDVIKFIKENNFEVYQAKVNRFEEGLK